MDGQGMVRASLEEEGTLLRLVMDVPKGNILSMAMMQALEAHLQEHRGRASLRLVTLEGGGGNFSFGASVEEHKPEMAPRMLAAFHRFIRFLVDYPTPLAAVVQGRCLGGAFEMVLACHFILATQEAQFGCPEIKLGVFPPMLAAVGANRLGGALAERLTLTGDTVGVEVLDRAGAITRKLGPDPWGDVLAWYRTSIKPLSAAALRNASAACRQGSGLVTLVKHNLHEMEMLYLNRVLGSHDGNEGIAAFLARRQPVWKDS